MNGIVKKEISLVLLFIMMFVFINIITFNRCLVLVLNASWEKILHIKQNRHRNEACNQGRCLVKRTLNFVRVRWGNLGPRGNLDLFAFFDIKTTASLMLDLWLSGS